MSETDDAWDDFTTADINEDEVVTFEEVFLDMRCKKQFLFYLLFFFWNFFFFFYLKNGN